MFATISRMNPDTHKFCVVLKGRLEHENKWKTYIIEDGYRVAELGREEGMGIDNWQFVHKGWVCVRNVNVHP